MVDNFFIREHIDELVELEDYVPVSFVPYDRQHERDEFLRSKNLLNTIQNMNELVRQKCNFCDDEIKAYNSLLIEWLDVHPEFEGIIAKESFDDYQDMKNNNEFISFVDLLYVRLPSEGFAKKRREYSGDRSIKDDSSIELPNFDGMQEAYDKYPNTLLACYLAYLV